MRLDKVLIVDGSYLLHRALHIEHLFELKTSTGIGTGGVFQFLRSLNSEVRKFQEYYPVVCWDAGLADRRLKIYPNYKHEAEKKIEEDELRALGKEPEVDEYIIEYRAQRQLVIKALSILGVPSLMFNGWEGDDLIYIISNMSDDCIVLTDDKDLIQLLSPTTRISRPMAGELLVYDEYQKEHNDPDMKKFIVVKSIVGDVSDNIPKCADRVGQKTAEHIADVMIEKRNDWREALEAENKIPINNFLTEESQKQFKVNLELIDLNRVPVQENIIRDISITIENGVHIPDFFQAMRFASKLEMEDLDMNGLVSILTMLNTKGEIFDE